MKERTFLLTIVLIICGGAVFLALGILGIIPVGSILIQLTYILSLSIIILFALIGAYFVGMITTHHIIRDRSFTPFERSMLEMREDVKKLVEVIDELKERIKDLEKEKKE